MAGFTHRKVTELKVMVPTATVTVTRHIYTPTKESDHRKEEQKCYAGTEDQVMAAGGHITLNIPFHSAYSLTYYPLSRSHMISLLCKPSDYINEFFLKKSPSTIFLIGIPGIPQSRMYFCYSQQA